MNTQLERSTDKERVWPVWVGSIEDLRRQAATVEQLAGVRRKALIASFDEQTEEQIEAVETNKRELERPGSSNFGSLSEPEFEEIVKANIKKLIHK